MTSVLANIPFPTMQPMFKGQPLTPEEQAHLAAFLQAAAAQQPRQATTQLGLLALVGFVVLMVLAQIVWRRRLQTVRRPLVGEA